MKNFNENFYIVCATVIPVFFLALTLQSSFIDQVKKYIIRFNSDAKRSQPTHYPIPAPSHSHAAGALVNSDDIRTARRITGTDRSRPSGG